MSKRGQSWELLRHLSKLHPIPWLCVGDFNEIISLSEKSNRSVRSSSQMSSFRRALEDCKLEDLGFVGSKFTWWNGRYGPASNRERLDRALANLDWSSLFNVVQVDILTRTSSNHHPVQISFSNARNRTWQKGSGFHFEAGWTKYKEHGDLIK